MQDSNATGREPDREPGEKASEAGEADEASGEEIHEPAKLVRLSRMIQASLTEIRDAGLDEQSRLQVRGIVDQIPSELVETVSPDLREELDRLRSGRASESPPSEAELRVEQAQLVGWLQGVLGGIQTALSAEQAGTQAELEQIRQQQGGERGQFPG